MLAILVLFFIQSVQLFFPLEMETYPIGSVLSMHRAGDQIHYIGGPTNGFVAAEEQDIKGFGCFAPICSWSSPQPPFQLAALQNPLLDR